MKKLSLLVLAVCTLGCSNQKVDTKSAFKDMKNQEIQVVSDAEIIEMAMQIGDSLAAQLEVSTDGEIVSWNSPDMEDILVVGLPFNQENILKGKERAMFEAYLYNTKNDIQSSPNVQFLEDPKFVLYSTAMLANGQELGMWSIKIPRKAIVLSVAK